MSRTTTDTTTMRAKLRSLAMTQRRIAHQYQAFAREDEAAGRLDAYRRNAAEAARLRSSVHHNLKFARQF